MRTGALFCIGLALTGCSYNPPREPAGDDASVGPDADPTACGWSYQPANIADVCALTFALGVDLAGITTYDTSSDMFAGRPTTLVAQIDGPEVRVVAVAEFELRPNSSLIVKGKHPLLIVVDGDARIEGAVIVTGTQTSEGPGSNDPTACAGSIGAPGGSAATSAGSGGGGGGFGGAGGPGGGAFDLAATVPGGDGGVASTDTSLVPLRGGCPGGAGGGVLLGPAGGAGGNAGGAVQVSARLEVSVGAVGSVLAGGGGGGGGLEGGSGGGGGGSGGGVQLEGTLVGIAGAVCANGGGGGSGGGGNGNPGDRGDDGGCSRATGALGGQEGGNAGDGGAGGAAAAPQGGMGFPDPDMDDDGGGGGGATGRIVILHAVGTTGVITPDPLLR